MTALTEVMDAIETFKKNHTEQLTEMRSAVEDLQKKANRPEVGNSGPTKLNTPELKAMDGAIRALISGNQEKANSLFVEAKAMSVGSGPDGGYVTNDMISSGITKVMIETSPIYRLARKVTLTSGMAFEEPIDKDAAAANWVGETSARTDTDTPEIAKFRVELKEIYAMPKATQTLIDQADIDVIGWLQEKVGEAFAVAEATAYHTGNGVACPRGILTYTMATTGDATRTWGQLQYVPTGASGAFHTTKADPLIDLVATLKPQYRNGAVWMMNRSTLAKVRKLKEATSDQYIWLPGLSAGQPDTLLGYPIEIDESMPDVAADTYSIAFGNIQKAYCIVQRPGVKFLTDPYTDKPNVRLYGYRRVGADVYNSEALKFLKFGTS
jgi:HK97 family phage major capsid protein